MVLQWSKADFVRRLTPLSLGDVALYGSDIVIRETDNADLSGSLTVQFDSTLTYKNRSDGSDFYDPGLLNLGPDSRIYILKQARPILDWLPWLPQRTNQISTSQGEFASSFAICKTSFLFAMNLAV